MVLGSSLARLNEMSMLLGGAGLLPLGEAHHKCLLDLVWVVDEIRRSMGQRGSLKVVLLCLALDDGVAEVNLIQFLSIVRVLAHDVVNEALLLPIEVLLEKFLGDHLVFASAEEVLEILSE